MTTSRESYIQGLIDTLSDLPGFPAGVYRSLSAALSREESPALVVHRGAEELESNLDDEADRQCEIRVSVISRGDTPDRDADNVMEVAHPAIMQFRAPGIQQLEEAGTDAPVFANTDGQACMVTTRYKVHYSTSRFSLSA